MNNDDFKRLVEPLCMLTGYCRSAGDLTKESNLLNSNNTWVWAKGKDRAVYRVQAYLTEKAMHQEEMFD